MLSRLFIKIFVNCRNRRKLTSTKSRTILEPKRKNGRPAARTLPTVVSESERVTRASRKRDAPDAVQQSQPRKRVKILQEKANCSKR